MGGDRMQRILIIEDDKAIVEELTVLLNNNGYEALVLTDFKHALEEILSLNPDLILLDMNIPHTSGDVLLKSLRKSSHIPVIMVTSRSSEIDEALSISYGADDYVTKPYNPTILLLRIGAVLKRLNTNLETLNYYDLTINLTKGIISNTHTEIILTKNEMILFSYLVNHQNKIVTRDALMTALWSNNEYVNDNTLTVNISRLRAKLKEVGYDDAIDTRKGLGYVLS